MIGLPIEYGIFPRAHFGGPSQVRSHLVRLHVPVLKLVVSSFFLPAPFPRIPTTFDR